MGYGDEAFMAQMGGVVITIEVSFFFFFLASIYAQKALVYKGVTFLVIA